MQGPGAGGQQGQPDLGVGEVGGLAPRPEEEGGAGRRLHAGDPLAPPAACSSAKARNDRSMTSRTTGGGTALAQPTGAEVWETTMVESAEAQVTLYEGRAIGVQLPQKMVFEVTDTIDNPAMGNTATNVTKDATIETGYVVQVPPFIKIGEKIRLLTEDGTYLERAN